MSVFRRKLASGRRSKLFTAEFQFRGQKIIRNGFPDREAAKLWATAEQLKLRRGAVGYVKPMLAAQVAPLIAAFAGKLKDKGCDRMYCYTAEKRLTRLAGECGWVTLGHVTRESLEAWLADGSLWRGKPVAAKTLNQFADIAVEWGKWLASPKVAKLPANPLIGAEMLPEKANNEYRRSASADDFNRLLAVCGEERRLYYLCRLYTPMRGRTYGMLTWRMAHLDAAPPYFATPDVTQKSRTDEKHAVRYQIAQELRKLRKRLKAKADDAIFPNAPTLDEFRADLATAGLPFELAKNKGRLDFHAFRRSVIKIGKAAGLSLDELSLLLGHRDSRTTRKYYDEDSVSPDLGRTVEALPTLGQVRKAE